jgi:hypothetical protein
MLGFAAILGGLFLGFRDLAPLLAARQSGVIRRKGSGAARVSREEDLTGFDRLLANRSKGAAIGFGVVTLGVIVTGLSWLSLVGFGGPEALVLLGLYAAFAGLAAYFLIRGFVTGRMFAVYGLSLFGDAGRRENPTWFWVYAAINMLVAINGAWILRQAFFS